MIEGYEEDSLDCKEGRVLMIDLKTSRENRVVELVM